MIDFAKTSPLDSECKLTHRAPWELGNREDGYMRGLDSLCETFAALFPDASPGC